MRLQSLNKKPAPERAILIGLKLQGTKRWEIEDSMAELEQLADTAGAFTAGKFIQDREKPDPATLIGQGKVDAIKKAIQDLNIDLIIFDDNLTPAQQKNLENSFEKKVVDRTGLILDIFAQRALTSEGKLQVELAQLEYLRPRLTKMWKHLSRLGGGIGTRGPGETQLEVDRRVINRRIQKIKELLKRVAKMRQQHRTRRKRAGIPVVALIGYTNSGKSTLLNALAGTNVFVENKLFATLDPIMRKVMLPNGHPILITDTVGFIRKLPHQLVAAFRATLEETIEADILVHIIDAVHPQRERQIASVKEVLEELGIADKLIIPVFNKIDLLNNLEIIDALEEKGIIPISALKGIGLDKLMNRIQNSLADLYSVVKLKIPFDRNDLLNEVYSRCKIIAQNYDGNATLIKASIHIKDRGFFADYIINEDEYSKEAIK